ncbi:T9SS type A sorting domain-containing protein [Lewinella sp. LCG006]|uniref:T9SS type A sorting domain-containing protein n=1 Tax=Lewinella sp. LCG006 TaxID=3231911 RepID=UPI003460BA2C
MKHLILLFSFCLLSSFAIGQTSFRTFGSTPAVVELQVFPNPAVDYIQVSTNQAVERIAVFNLAGREIKAFTYRTEDKYYVGDLPKGMYLVQLVGAQNSRIGTRRISIR